MFFKIKFIFFAVILVFFATSCVETVVVGSVATGVLITREKSISKTSSDIAIATNLGSKFIVNGLKNPGNSVDITVNEGRVLLTGIVRKPENAKLAQTLAWKVSGVKEVIDEIQFHEDEFYAKDFSSGAVDYVITGEIESKLLVAKGVSSMNFQVTTVGKVVYLLGVAQDDFEMQKVLAVAAKVRGVKEVVNHIILANDSRRRS
jgi:osmotically-inducible protein OsmY